MSSRSSMSNRFDRVHVSFVCKRPGIYSATRITPNGQWHRSGYGTSKSIRSTPLITLESNDSPILTNDRLVSTTVQPFQHPYKLNSDQSYLNNHQKISSRKKKFSCKQKSMLLAFLFIALLLLITFILPYVLIYFLSQKVTFLMQVTQVTLSEISNHKYHCGGVTTSPAWGTYTSFTLSLFIDTSSCKFNSTPLYFTSFSGIGYHYGLAGHTAIYGPSSTSFTIFVSSIFSWNSVQMLNFSDVGQWNINWLGVT